MPYEGIGGMGPEEAEVKFMQSLGQYGIRNGEIISDPMGFKSMIPCDRRPQIGQIVQKAFNTQTGGAGPAGYAMIPVYVDPNIIDVSRKYTPLIEMFPKVANMGMTADYNNITAKGSAAYLAEDAALNDQNDTYARSSSTIKFAYSRGRVTGPTIAAVPPYNLQMYNPQGSGLAGSTFASGVAPNANQLEVLVKSRALFEIMESKLINGNATSYPTEPNGIVALQSTTNKVDLSASGTALSLSMDDIRTAIQYAFDYSGRPNLGVCDSATYNDILALIEDHQRAGPTVNIFGIDQITLTTMVGNIPIIPSQYLTNTSGSKSLYFLDMSVWENRVLQDVMYERMAKTNDSEKFMLKAYHVPICRNTKFNSWIGGIA